MRIWKPTCVRCPDKGELMYKLYYADGSAAMGIRAILEEIGAKYELIETNIEYQTQRAPDLLAHNPNGWVPVLIWDEMSMYEAAAITIFLCEKHPEAGLAPGVDDEEARSQFLQWLIYFTGTVQNAFQMSYYPDRFANQPGEEPSVQARSVRRLREVWSIVDAALSERKWIAGDKFTAADIYMFMLTTWLSPEDGHPELDEFPNVFRVVKSLSDRDSIKTVYGPQ